VRAPPGKTGLTTGGTGNSHPGGTGAWRNREIPKSGRGWGRGALHMGWAPKRAPQRGQTKRPAGCFFSGTNGKRRGGQKPKQKNGGPKTATGNYMGTGRFYFRQKLFVVCSVGAFGGGASGAPWVGGGARGRGLGGGGKNGRLRAGAAKNGQQHPQPNPRQNNPPGAAFSGHGPGSKGQKNNRHGRTSAISKGGPAKRGGCDGGGGAGGG